MESNYTIKKTPKAVDGLENIYRYISEEVFAASTATRELPSSIDPLRRIQTAVSLARV